MASSICLAPELYSEKNESGNSFGSVLHAFFNRNYEKSAQ